MKNLKKTLLVCGLLSVAVGVFAQDEAKTLPVLREGKGRYSYMGGRSASARSVAGGSPYASGCLSGIGGGG